MINKKNQTELRVLEKEEQKEINTTKIRKI